MKSKILVLTFVCFIWGFCPLAAQSEWGNWGRMTCNQGFEARVKSNGFIKSVNQYSWIAEVRNNYPVKATFNMFWTVGGEKHNIGQFTIGPGGISNAVSYYFTSNADMMYVTVQDVCFGENKWCKCKADCDAKPGVPNQVSEEVCNGLTSSPQNNSNNWVNTNSNTNYNNNSASKTTIIPQNSTNDNTNYNGSLELAPPLGGQSPTVYNNNTRMAQNSLNQYNQLQAQKSIRDIQNTPIKKFSVDKPDIQIVKKPASKYLDKGAITDIIQAEKIEIELAELMSKNEIMEKRCIGLANFRDNQLQDLYEKALKKYVLNQNSLDYVANLKKDLFEDSKWEDSQVGHSVAVLSNFINTTCNLILNLNEFNPAIKNSANLFLYTKKKAVDILDLIDKGEDIYSVLSGDANGFALELVLEKFGPVGQAIKTAKDLADDLVEFNNIEEGVKGLKVEVKSAFEKIELEIARYNQALLASKKLIQRYNEIKLEINNYIKMNCQPSSIPKAILH